MFSLLEVAPVMSFLPPGLALGATVRLNPRRGATVGVVGRLVVGSIVGMEAAAAVLASAALAKFMHPRHPSLAMAIPIPMAMLSGVSDG